MEFLYKGVHVKCYLLAKDQSILHTWTGMLDYLTNDWAFWSKKSMEEWVLNIIIDKRTVSIKRTVKKFYKESLLNVPYDLEKK